MSQPGDAPVRQMNVIGAWQEGNPIRRRVLVTVVPLAVLQAVSLSLLFSVALSLASCGYEARMVPYVTSPALGLAQSGRLTVVLELGNAVVSYSSGVTGIKPARRGFR